MLTSLIALTAIAQFPVEGMASVVVNGQVLAEKGLVRRDRVQVPMRRIFELLGASVQYFPETKTIFASTGQKEVTLILGQAFAFGHEVGVVDQVPHVVDGRVYVPLRYVSETLGATVNWDAKIRTATIEIAAGN